MRVTHIIFLLVLVACLVFVDAAPASHASGGQQRFRSLRKSTINQANVLNQRVHHTIRAGLPGKSAGGSGSGSGSNVPLPTPKPATPVNGNGGASAAAAAGAAGAANGKVRPPALDLKLVRQPSSDNNNSPLPQRLGNESPASFTQRVLALQEQRRAADDMRLNIEGSGGVTQTAHDLKGLELQRAYQNNPINTVGDALDAKIAAANQNLRCHENAFVRTIVAPVCSAAMAVAASPVTVITKPVKAGHQAAKDHHDGKSAWHITQGVVVNGAVPLAKAAAVIGTAGASAGVDQLATELGNQVAQEFIAEAGTGIAKNLLTSSPPASPSNVNTKQGGGAAKSASSSATAADGTAPTNSNSAAGGGAAGGAASRAAKKALLALKSRVVSRSAARIKAKTPASDVIALAAQFNASGAARVKLAQLLAISGRVNLGTDANAALRRIGLPVTPLSSVDIARTFLRVKYASGTITVTQWKQGEAQLNDPKVQQATNEVFAKAAQAVVAARKK